VPRKILVMELAGLGDDVHLLPALWVLREQARDAQLHVMVSAHVADLFELAPWVDRVWKYPRVPRRPGVLANLGWMRALRRERFDLVINTTGSDRSALLAGFSGARTRIARRPPSGGRFWFDRLFDRVIDYPFWQEPMYRQKLAVFAQAGFASSAPPRFEVRIDDAKRRALGIAAVDDRRYLHLSPCAGHERKEIPVAQLADLCNALREAHPQLRLVVSCADLPRERARTEALIAALAQPPWHVFAGSLRIPELTSVIAGARLHLCGDSGSLHLALMSATPAVAWLRQHVNLKEWMPQGDRYRMLIGADDDNERALTGVDNRALIDAANELIA
jgi:ADP-heptose:LPS heptosyltransferase